MSAAEVTSGSDGSEAQHLWNIDHPYYCSESNFFSNETGSQYASWPEFLSSEGDNDMDLNLVFRWDWKRSDYTTGDEGADFDARYDDNYRAYTLQVFWMGQRKGIFRCTEVSVCRADEPSVREWLAARWQHMQTLWEPFGGGGAMSAVSNRDEVSP